MKNVIVENIIKNILILLLLVPAYYHIQSVFSPSAFLDKSVLGSVLVAVSILSVTACFGNFAFTYERVRQRETASRLLAHATTGLLMLLIGLSLEMTSVIVGLLIGKFLIFDASLVILYSASVLYDFWDLKRSDLESAAPKSRAAQHRIYTDGEINSFIKDDQI